MDWKKIWADAFPKAPAGKPTSYPKLQGPGPWPSSSLPNLQKPGPGDASSYPQLKGPGAGEAGSYPQLKGPGAGEGGIYPQLKGPGPWPASSLPGLSGQKKWPGSTLPGMLRDDHIGEFGFRVEIEGVSAGHFTKVEGLNISIETIEYQHGDDITPRKRPGRIKVDNVRLIKGYVNTPALYNWCNDVMKGDVSHKSVSVVLLADDKGTELSRYNLFDVWPCKWSGFKLDGKGQGALVEEIELVCESLQRG